MLATELDPEILHELSKRYPEIIKHLGQLNPEIRKDGTAYSCLSGLNPTEGIFGSGMTEEEALEDWEKAWQTKNQNS